jgi:hypothetical protein
MTITNTSEQDLLYNKLLGMMTQCSEETENSCATCPVQDKCERWWNMVISKRDFHFIRSKEYARYKAKFDIIRASKNGSREATG